MLNLCRVGSHRALHNALKSFREVVVLPIVMVTMMTRLGEGSSHCLACNSSGWLPTIVLLIG